MHHIDNPGPVPQQEPAQRTQGWRTTIETHPAAELFPLMSETELAELSNDIKVKGLVQFDRPLAG